MGRTLAVCYGTRPQVIKASRLCVALRERWPVVQIDTGQHYDYLLNRVFYEQLGAEPPDHLLEVASGTHAEQTAAILTRSAALLATIAPAAVVVIGDTNSTVGCALAAAQLRIPVVHVEAGLRAVDRFMAEDINRRVTDSISTVLCAPSETAERTLLEERAGGLVRRTGDIAYDVLLASLPLLPPAPIEPWPAGPVAFATLHRAELTDHRERMESVIEGLGRLGVPVVFPAHPRTRDRLARHGLADRLPTNLHCIEPLGYFETLAAIRRAKVVVTDSGGIQREAYWLGTPCVTVRTETEWPETIGAGANVLVPPELARDQLPLAVRQHLRQEPGRWVADAYGTGSAARAIVEAIVAAGLFG